jgi:outer membrane protein assembly factor BamB
VAKTRSDYLSQEIVALPSMHPLAVGDVVVVRTAFAIEAIDFHSGKLVWKYPSTDDSLEQFAKAGSSQQPTSATQQLLSGLEARMWDDAVYGTLSSDSEQVYFIEGLGLAGANSNMLMTVLPNGQRRYSANSRGTNRLAARELRTQGKLKWEVGGMTGEDEPKLAGAFFLGPPLPLLGRLYVLAELRGQEIRLLALSPKTGALEWSQQLAVVEQSVTSDGFRRNAGATPSFADGVLVCPTSGGAVVGIDITTRSLLWGYQYPRAQQFPSERFVNGRLTVFPGSERKGNERWTDATVTIADGHVLLTPVETDQLYCLSLPDGKELWKKNRSSALYVACVHRDRVILVGHNTVSAVRLNDGEKAWAADLQLPDGSLPSGRGFYSGKFYYLPITSAEVAKIDLETGQIVERARSRSGTIPGNLVCYRDSIISQTADYVDAHFQLDKLKDQIAGSLARQPDDPKALAGLGEVKLDERKLTEAVELFRRSYRLKNDEATREQLVESLIEALRVDFAANRGGLDELDALIEQPRHRVDFLRLKALGLQAAGETVPAFETYMKLVDAPAASMLETIDERLTARRDRWVRARLETLLATATSVERQPIDAVVKERLDAALGAKSADALRGYLDVFGSHPAALAARDSLITHLTSDDLLERGLLLRKLERSNDELQVALATARLAKMLQQAGRADLAAVYYRQLAGRFAAVKCWDDKTGEQLVAELAAEDPVRKGLAAERAWPTGNVTARDDKPPARAAVASQRMQRAIDLEIIGPSNPLFKDVTISYDMQQHLVAEDGLGEKRFRIPLSEQGGRRLNTINRNAYNAPVLSYASVNGGLLVLSLGSQLVAVDTLRAGEGASNRVLWTQDLNDPIGGFPTNQGVLSRPVNLPWGGVRYVPEDAFGRRLGSIGPVNDNGVFFQRLHDVYCVDPLTGKTQWTRKNAGLGNDLFGDEELLFVAPPGDGDTLVLRAATGESLGVRRAGPFDRRMATLGRRVLSWETKNLLQMRDVWQDQTLWSHPFAPGSKAALVSQEAVGVFQPDGNFSLITLADGKVLVKERLEPENSLLGIILLRTTEGYLLVTNVAARNEPNVSVQPIPASPNNLISGRIYAFERATGRKLWPAPATVLQYGLHTGQPAALPVLVLARQVLRPGPPNGREPKVSVLCIDKRTGRVVYHNEDLPGSTIANVELVGDPVAGTVTISLPARVITLTFTDEAKVSQAAKGAVR